MQSPTIDVRGISPVTQGSLNAYSAGVVTDRHSKQLKPYRKLIADRYRESAGPFFETYTPVKVTVTFWMKAPKKPKAFAPSTKKCDLDKLQRAVGDALTGVAYADDCQITSWVATKRYVDDESQEGLTFKVDEDYDTEDN